MLKAVMHPFGKGKKTDKPGRGRDTAPALDGEAVEHLERLKTKFPQLSEDKLMALALKYLDRKTDKIIRRRLSRRIRTLKNRGFSVEQIAEHLNRQKVSPLSGTQNRHGGTVADVLEGKKRIRAERRGE
jgi:hypothetical protein